jgi:hypothetical protein
VQIPSKENGGQGLAPAVRQALKAFAESFGYHARHGFAGLLSDGGREPMGFGSLMLRDFIFGFL